MNLPDGKTSKGWIVSEGLYTHRLGGYHLDDSSVARLDELGGVFNRFTGTTVNLFQELGELAGNVGGVAIKHWCVTSTDLARVVKNNDLGIERFRTLRRVILGITSNIATTDFLYGNVLDVEADIVAWDTLNKLLMVHLNGLDFSSNTWNTRQQMESH